MQRLKVSASCPSCGAPFEFLEGSNVSRCPFCNLPFFFQSPERILSYYLESRLSRREVPFIVDRFRKEQKEALPDRIEQIKLCYLSFWRFTAQVFYAKINLSFLASPQEEKEIEILTKDWDINFPAHISNDLKIATLGMRPDWLKLKFLTGINLLKDGQVLDQELSPKEAKEKAAKSLNFFMQDKKSREEELILKLVDENLSLLYFPLWVVNFIAGEEKYFQIIDGIAKRTLFQSRSHFELKTNISEGAKESYSLRIVPHRCPNCGWDLPVLPFHLVFPCENCQRVWKISEEGYLPVKAEITAPEGQKTKTATGAIEYYPLWVFQAKPRDDGNFTIRKLAELFPSEIGWFQVRDKSKPFLFYVPAFEIKNLNKIPSISLAFTRSQPDLEKKSWETEKLNGAIRSEEDARKIAELLWLGIIHSKINFRADNCKDLILENAKIIWYPFQQEGAFLTDSSIGYSFQKTK
jgi:predicted Zn-ribbon and HTH transcriptional regulator